MQKHTIMNYAVMIKNYCATHTCDICPFCDNLKDINSYCKLIKVMPEDWPVKEKKLKRSRQKPWLKEECSQKASY